MVVEISHRGKVFSMLFIDLVARGDNTLGSVRLFVCVCVCVCVCPSSPETMLHICPSVLAWSGRYWYLAFAKYINTMQKIL